jgi:hypothetical protein
MAFDTPLSINEIAKSDKARIIPTGIQALNLLGLSTSGAYEGGLSYRWCTAEYLHARLAPAWISKIMISTFEM